MYKLGITGGIGSGKTTVSNYIEQTYDSVYLFNADKESKSHLKKSLSLQHRIINVFGSAVTVNNKLEISKLAEVAFSDKINQNILNGIMWAEVFILINNKIEECQKSKTMDQDTKRTCCFRTKGCKTRYERCICKTV